MRLPWSALSAMGITREENDMGVKEVCGTCKYNQYSPDGNGIRNKGGFYCGNERSENCGVPTFYDDTCDEWEEKE